ncbi:MAG: N-acetylglutaminylglutamine amidotransferase [Gammaproteobacteria bacterium]|nr:N-acetylglutaminylglutamine amidotransferase [Gammaproteobacteria bacterium]
MNMCGICGEIRFDDSIISEKSKKLMMDAVASRGPDNKGIYEDESFFFGHSRLSIIDTSPKSNQPMIDVKLSLSITFNGVIYNYRSLKKDLESKGYIFDTDGDTEVILKAYHFYGEDCVKFFDGTFAFCIYDKSNRKFFLSRDRFGIKPLYYRSEKDCFSFSSTTKSLIRGSTEKINTDALNHHFLLHSSVPAPKTIFSSIQKLPPGNSLTITESGTIKQRQYYSIGDISIEAHLNENEILQNIERIILNAIKKRLCVSDVPVGVLLSGGLDSSLITAMASKHKLAEVETFSIGFDTISTEIGDEFYYSDLVSKQFSSKHEKIIINEIDLLESLDSVIANMPEPMSGQDAAAFYLLAKEVSKKRKVVLSGQGADELFGGYPWYALMSNGDSDDIDRFSRYYLDRSIEDFKQTVNKSFFTEHATNNFISSSFEKYNKNLSFLDKLLRFDISYLIVDDPVKRVDSMTMAWGLETRVPFLDQELIEYLSSIPSESKLKNHGKYYLKKIAERYLSSDVIYRKKFHFPVPPLKIIKDKILSYSRLVLQSEACNKRGIFNQKNIENLLNKPNENFTRLEGNKLWHLTVFERWFQLNVDKKNPL